MGITAPGYLVDKHSGCTPEDLLQTAPVDRRVALQGLLEDVRVEPLDDGDGDKLVIGTGLSDAQRE